MGTFDWRKLLSRISSESKSRDAVSLADTPQKIRHQAVIRAMQWAFILLGFGFALCALGFKESWVMNSPLFTILGRAACALFLCVSWLIGSIWWLLTGSNAVLLWVKSLWPCCVQPYRSAAGIPVCFGILAMALWLLPPTIKWNRFVLRCFKFLVGLLAVIAIVTVAWLIMN